MKAILVKFGWLAVFGLVFILPSKALFAQQPQSERDATVDSETRSKVVDALLKRLNDEYVFPETAKKMEADIRKRQNDGEYDGLKSSNAFAERLTTDLQSVSHDKHLRVRFSDTVIPMRKENEEPSVAEKTENEQHLRFINDGFER